MLTDKDRIDLNEVLKNLIHYYGSNYDSVKIGTAFLSNPQVSGFLKDNHIIIINELYDYNRCEKSLFHEFRHIWQKFNYPNLYNFWINCPEYKPGSFIYRNCSIERDARRFSMLQNGYDSTDILDEWNSNPELELIHLKEVDPNKD